MAGYEVPIVSGGWTMEDIWWPRVTLTEQIMLFLGLEKDKAFGARYRQACWIGQRIAESCRASRLHPPQQPHRTPQIAVFVPGAPPGLQPLSEDYLYLLKPAPGVRASRFNSAFLQDVNTRLGGYKATLTVQANGIWLVVPLERCPQKPPACRLADLGEPPANCRLPLPLGLSVRGALWADLAQAPHALVAGASGSGKSTLIHACLHFLLDRAEVWGIDLKLVELSRYQERARIVTDPTDVAPLLTQLFVETRRRLTEMEQHGLNIWRGQRIVLVVDELAEVTLASKGDTQILLRLAQIGRAAGVHLLLATQRPSVQIVPGDLKANVPLRVALALPTGVDSRVVLDTEGAETLSPPGDALVLQGHRIVRISTPNYTAPPPPLDAGAADDLRLVGLSPDARAVFRAIEQQGYKGAVREVKEHFHWGSARALAALRELRAAGMLVADDAPGTDGTDGTDGTVPDVPDVLHPTNKEPVDIFMDLGNGGTPGTVPTPVPVPEPELLSDVEILARAIANGVCTETRRAIQAHFHWGAHRAMAALRARRASPTPEH